MFPVNAMVENLVVYDKNFACNSTKLLSEVSFFRIIFCDDIGNATNQVRAIMELRMVRAILVSTELKLFELGGVPCQYIVISPKEASTVRNYVETSHMPFGKMSFQQTIIGRRASRAPTMAFYSSRRPSYNSPGVLKPDIMASGSLILATWISNVPVGSIGPGIILSSEYNMIFGTSIASPHVSGVAALLKAAHQEWSPATFRSALMMTTFTFDNT